MLENVFVYWVFLIVNALVFALSIFLMSICSDESNINHKKLFVVILVLGPAGWVGGLIGLCINYVVDHIDNILDWFRK